MDSFLNLHRYKYKVYDAAGFFGHQSLARPVGSIGLVNGFTDIAQSVDYFYFFSISL